jgi:phage shock protein PspC (stress-responsive transcriptional regulator)
MIAGVCGGLGKYFNVNPVFVLYAAVWLYTSGKGWLTVVVALAATGLALRGLGLGPASVCTVTQSSTS